MSVESLPYTLLLLLGQFTAGVAAFVLFAQVRGTYEAAFLRTCVWMVVGGATCLTMLLLAIDPVSSAGGYALDPDALKPLRALSFASLLFSCVYMYFLRKDDEPFLALATGATTVALGAIMLVLLASLVRIPTWSIAGPLLTMFAGAATLGVFTVAMVWGHWYLVKPSLEAGPLNTLTLISIGAIVLQLGVTVVNAVIPVGTKIDSDALLAVDLAQNPGFWLRIGIGLVFPGVLALMAYQSSKEHSMMSATGLLYIAVGAILAGEALGRGLLFVTGAAV